MLRYYFTLALFLIIAASATAQRRDTIAVINKPHKIEITKKASGDLKVDVYGSKNSKDFSYHYSNTYNSPIIDSLAASDGDDVRIPFIPILSDDNSDAQRVKIEWFYSLGAHWGLNMMSDAPSGVGNMSGSAELGLLNPLSLAIRFKDSWRIVTGVGFGWKNYRLSTAQRFVCDEAGSVSIAAYQDGAYNRLSRLKLFYIDVPVILKKSFGNFAVGVGAVVNFNCHGSILTRYRIDDDKYKSVIKNINYAPVTVDLLGTVCYNSFGLYVKYNPCNVLKSGSLPEFKSFSIGCMVGF